MTPLLSAIYEGHLECVRLLLQRVCATLFCSHSSHSLPFPPAYQITICDQWV